MNWIEIGKLDDIPPLGARIINTHNGNIAVFRTGEDEVFALDDSCPHKNGPLSQGIVHDRRVTCPLHNWVISLETGEAGGADTGCTRKYPAKVENELVYISISQNDGNVEQPEEPIEAIGMTS